MQDSVNWAHEVFLKQIYRTEDSLYQVIYDKAYRPDVFKAKTSSQATDKPDYSDFRIRKALDSDSVSFVEARFLEQVNSIRLGLVQKYPLIIFGTVSLLLSRSLIR